MQHQYVENQQQRQHADGVAAVAEAANPCAGTANSDLGVTAVIADAAANQMGTVIRSGAGNYLVRIGACTWSCTLKKKLTLERQRVTSLVCVGDRVIVDRLTAYSCPSAVAGVEVAGTGVITEILPRLTALTRLSPPDMPGRAPLQQVLAANVDLGVIVVAALRPPFRMGTVERYLIMCRQAGIEPLVCINKVDQVETEYDRQQLDATRASLVGRGARVVLTSAETDFGVADLQGALSGRTAVFMGPSGVGKTSLLKRMCPGLEAKTLTISTATNKGRHSTTTASLVDVGGGYVADLPGLRTLGLWHLEEEVVRSEYEDIEEIGLGCKFNDCSHTHEPGCAVKAAVESGDLDEERYRRYVKVMKETTKRPNR